MTDFMNSLKIAATGLHAQSARMRIIAENMANSSSAAKEPGADPYRRRVPTFQAVYNRDLSAHEVKIGKVGYDMSDFQSRYEPGHPAANERGYVLYPNVNSLIETMDMREAQRTYEANLNVISTSRAMLGGTLDILRG
ncbi:flagellar basal body rod protein FlgC [Maritalea sp.]|uniref:flagellar basal body rod protein FlgC n=1 Tax=Maritalea sp. TaxID=2003361 RepID=UPI003EF84303